MIGIIGGSGFYDVFEKIADGNTSTLSTPFGDVEVIKGNFHGQTCYFISRHGRKVLYPPHAVNYKGHIWALKQLGVERVFATSAVGSVNDRFEPGQFVIPDQYLDLTKTVSSFFNGGSAGIFHVDMTDPFCPTLSSLVNQLKIDDGGDGDDADTGKRLMDVVHCGGCYACLPGPAFETRAEIKMVQVLGADLVGMTLVPEAKLAREAGLCYLPITMIVNWGAGLTDEPVAHEHTVEMVERMQHQLFDLLRALLDALRGGDETVSCHCASMGAPLPDE